MDSLTIDALCRIPATDPHWIAKSMRALARAHRISDLNTFEKDVEAQLRRHPELVERWLAYSEDQRCSPAWYFARPGNGLDGKDGWRVGYYTSSQRAPENRFEDEFSACAFFIARKVEEYSL